MFFLIIITGYYLLFVHVQDLPPFSLNINYISLLHFLNYMNQIMVLLPADNILAVKRSKMTVIFRVVGHSSYIGGEMFSYFE